MVWSWTVVREMIVLVLLMLTRAVMVGEGRWVRCRTLVCVVVT